MNNVDLVQNYQTHLPKNKSAHILDFGCGQGRIISFLVKEGFTNVSGVDVDERLVAEVKKTLPVQAYSTNDTIAFLCSQPESYDLIIAKDVIYYFSKVEAPRLFTALFSALKPGGTIIVEVFNGAALTGQYIKYKDLGIQAVYSEQSLRALLQNAGLVIKQLHGKKTCPTGVRSMIHYFMQKIWHACLRVIYFSERGYDSENPTILDKQLIAVGVKAVR